MTLGARRQSTSNYCSVTLLTQRVNSLHIELKLIKTVYSASIPLTSLLKTRNSSSSFRGLINALDREQYHTLTFRDFQSVNEKREMEPGRHGALLGCSLHGLLTCPGRWGCSVWQGQRSPHRGSTAPPWQGNCGTGKMVEPSVQRLRAHRVMTAGVKQLSEGTMSRRVLLWDQISWSPGMVLGGFSSKRHSSLVTVFPLKIKIKTKQTPNQTFTSKSKITIMYVLNPKFKDSITFN